MQGRSGCAYRPPPTLRLRHPARAEAKPEAAGDAWGRGLETVLAAAGVCLRWEDPGCRAALMPQQEPEGQAIPMNVRPCGPPLGPCTGARPCV